MEGASGELGILAGRLRTDAQQAIALLALGLPFLVIGPRVEPLAYLVAIVPAVAAFRRAAANAVAAVVVAVFVVSIAGGQPAWALLVVILVTVGSALRARDRCAFGDLRAVRGEVSGWADALLAAVIASLVFVELTDTIRDAPVVAILALTPVILTFRRSAPVIASVTVTLASVLIAWLQNGQGPWQVAVLPAFALYSLAAHRSLTLAAPVAVNSIFAYLALVAFGTEPLIVDGHTVNALQQILAQPWVLAVAALLLGSTGLGALVRATRGRNRTLRELRAREISLLRQAEEFQEKEALHIERANIARDLHDVIAHHVSLMVLQSETGPYLVQRGGPEAVQGFEQIGDSGRRALGELDRMLSALRDTTGTVDPDLEPQPGLADLQQLAATVSAQGPPVDFHLQGSIQHAPESHQLSSYRIAQEALTNMLRYSKASRASLKVLVEPDLISIEITDNGRGFDPAAASETGRHGLAGMKERASVHGGSLVLTSAPGAGTIVRASIPIDQEAQE